jgi:hypothetical protein
VIFGSAREGPRNLFWQAANNTGAAARLSQSSTQQQDPYALSPDGTLVFKESSPKTGWDLKALVLDKPDQVRTLVSTASNEVTAALTHDGRWLAYQSDESGRDEIYVRPFPDVDSNRWTISTGGGTMPVWSRSGDELFYVSLTRALMRVPIRRSAGFSFAPPEKLFDWPYQVAVNPNNGHTYDPSLDGSKFLVIKNPNRPDQAAPASITVVQNWFEELKGLVPVP